MEWQDVAKTQEIEIAALKEKLRTERLASGKYHRRVQAMEGPWQARLDHAQMLLRYYRGLWFDEASSKGHEFDKAQFMAGQWTERADLRRFLLDDKYILYGLKQYQIDKITAYLSDPSTMTPPPERNV